ncbi:hypothetical protein BDA96_10G294400 [Sorghum bicolor]|uniref:Uncharacterized protein n=1 Tax=Sorghum bicolor TaxID=4558 RepID=A0A921U2E6_SORBI|nr:hypothetical protein BDA96_10G294400 [Sorghum bicolor]
MTTQVHVLGRSSVGVRRVPSADLQGGRRRPVGQSTSSSWWGRGRVGQRHRAQARPRGAPRAHGGGWRRGGSAAAGGGGWRRGWWRGGGARRRMAAHGGGWRRGAVEAAHGGGCRMQDAAWCLPYCLCRMQVAWWRGWPMGGRVLFNRRPRRTPSIPLFAGLGGEVGRTPELAI